MDEQLEHLEAELGRLRPIRPGPRLKAGIAADPALAGPQRIAWWRPALAAAAAVLLALGLRSALRPAQQLPRVAHSHPPAPPPPPAAAATEPPPAPEDFRRRVYRPVRVQTALLGHRDDGIVLTSRNRPVHRMSCRLIDHMEWQSIDGKRRITITRPREEVVLAGVTVL